MGVEADSHIGGIGSVLPEVPSVRQLVGRVPHRDFPPIVFHATFGSLVDASTDLALHHDLETGFAAAGVI